MSKEKEILDKTLTFNYGEMLDKIHDHISKLRFVAISSVNSLEEKDKEIERLNNIINEIEEYLTSYESISTIQGLENIEDNKKLDEKTIIEMTRRYLIVHDNILDKIKELRGDSK